MESMQQSNLFLRFQRIGGNLFFLVLLIYAIVYAKERTTYVDSAWIFFQQVNHESFGAALERFPAFFIEIPLFLGVKAGLSFGALIYLFSCSYILFFYLIWYLITYRLKNPVAGLVVIFGTFMGIRELFIHTITETHQCIVYSALLYAVMCFEFKSRNLRYALTAFVTLFAAFSHPFGVFTAAFVLVFFAVHKRDIRNAQLYIAGIIVVGTAALNLLNPPNAHDQSQYQLLTSVEASGLASNNAALHFLKIHFSHFYWLPELAALFAIGLLIVKREFIKLSLLVVATATYVCIAAYTFRNGDSSIMLERIFLPAFFIINLTLADVLSRQHYRLRWLPIILVLFFMINGIRYINTGCLMYRKRVAYLDELVQKAIAGPSDKYILDESAANKDLILVPWALGVETLIYSKFKYNECVTITLDKEGCDPESARITTQLCLPVAALNPEYFILSTNPYQPLP
jgi:hypothetical protein